MITKYKTIESALAASLDDEITQHLQLGWELHGAQYYTGFHYVQVVTLKEE